MQGMGDSLPRPRPADHDLRQSERAGADLVREPGLCAPGCFCRQASPCSAFGPAPRLADWLVARIGEHKVKGRVRGVGIETVHECFVRCEGITRCDRIGVSIAVNERDRFPDSAGTPGVMVAEGQIWHARSLLPSRSRAELMLNRVEAHAELLRS